MDWTVIRVPRYLTFDHSSTSIPRVSRGSYAMHHHSHASTIMSSFRIILALINEPRPWTRTRGTRRGSKPWNGLEMDRIYKRRLCRYAPSWFDTSSIFPYFSNFGRSEETFVRFFFFCKSFHFRGSYNRGRKVIRKEDREKNDKKR